MNGEPADSLGAQLYIGFIAVLGLASAGVARAAVDQARTARSTRLARLGGAALLLGVAIGAGRWLAQWSLEGDGAAGIATTLYFLFGGVLFTVSALGHRAQQLGRGPDRARRGAADVAGEREHVAARARRDAVGDARLGDRLPQRARARSAGVVPVRNQRSTNDQQQFGRRPSVTVEAVDEV